MAQCSACNFDNPENARFCNQCGEVLLIGSMRQTQPTTPSATSLPSATPTANRPTGDSIFYKLAKWDAVGRHPEAWPAAISSIAREKWSTMGLHLKVVSGVTAGLVILFAAILVIVLSSNNSNHPKLYDEVAAQREASTPPAKTNSSARVSTAAASSVAITPTVREDLISDLFRAASSGTSAEIAALIDQGAPVNARAADQRTPLFDAVMEGNLEAVKTLIEKGADVNARHKEGFTALYWAVMNTKSHGLNLVRTLVEYCSDISAKDRQGDTPLKWAKRHGRREVVEVLTHTQVLSNLPSREIAEAASPNSSAQDSANRAAQQKKRVYFEGVRKLPLAKTQDDFFGVEDAISSNRDREALRMMQRGRYVMVENNSSIIVIENAGYLSKVKILNIGRVGWLKTSWIVE